jgi:nucleoside-diphosphate-sugar epimerase
LNILITGANGFIGRSIVEFGLSGHELFRGSRKEIDLFDLKSISTFLKINKIDVIIHCAIEGNGSSSDTEQMYKNNVKMFENLSIFRNDIKTLVNIASGAEFDRRRSICRLKEFEISNSFPIDLYGKAKNFIAKKCLAIPNFKSVRVFGCFGKLEKQSRLISYCLNQISKKECIDISQDREMDYIYIEDLITVIRNAVKSDAKDVNACYRNKLKISDLAKKVAEKSNGFVDVNILSKSYLDYSGDSSIIDNMNLDLIGLDRGIDKFLSK